MSRRQYFIKTKHKRRKHLPPVWRKDSDSETVPEPSVAVELPPSPRPAVKPRKTWQDYARTSGMLLTAVLVSGYVIYFLATAKPGRAVYFEQKSNVPHLLPTHPGHRDPATSQSAGAIVEHSLADRLPPTDQSFRDTFGGSRSIGPERSDVGSGGESQALPDKVKLREDLAGECEIGSNGRFDIEKCLRRHSVAAN